VLLISILGSAFGYFLFGWAGSLWVLFLSRIIDGLTGGNISTAQAYIADMSRPEDRAKNFGLIGAAFGLGFLLGPAIGGALSKISLQAPAFGAGIVSLATLSRRWCFCRSRCRRGAPEGGVPGARSGSAAQIVGPLRRPMLRWLLPGFFMLSLAMSGLQSNFAVYTLNRYGLTPPQNGWILCGWARCRW